MIYLFIFAVAIIIALGLMYLSSKKDSTTQEDLDEDFIEFPKIAKIKAIKIRKEEYQVSTGKYGALYYVKNNKRHYLTESQKTKIYEI